MFFTLLPVSALAEDSGSTGTSHVTNRTLNTDDKDNQGLTYTLNTDNTATVAKYDNSTQGGVIDIPDTVTKDTAVYTVTAIGDSAFDPLYMPNYVSNVSSVFIPATVTSIGTGTFSCCKFLATVTFAEGSQLKSIGPLAFSGTNQAHPKFTEIKIPDSVETIGNGAFYFCLDLKSITLPASLKTIKNSAFRYCRNLSEINLPASLTAIESNAFNDCISLKTLSYDGSLAQWSQINVNKDFLSICEPNLITTDYTVHFEDHSSSQESDRLSKRVTITQYKGTESTTAIPETIGGWPVTKIGEDAFKDNTTITSVTIPASVTAIGSNAFAGCTNLTSVKYAGDWNKLTIQSGNPAIEDAAKDAANEQLFDFAFTVNSTAVIVTHYKGAAADVTIPSSYKGKPVTTIGNDAFKNNHTITNVTIPSSVTFIGQDAFAGCKDLKTVNYPGTKTQWDSIFKSPEDSSMLSPLLICATLEATFDPDNGESISKETIDRGGKFTEPTSTPEKEGYTFIGWYNGNEKFDFSADTTDAPNVLDLVAKWSINQYTVTFVTAHGTIPDPQTVDHGKTATRPTMEAEGYTFGGWYTDKACKTPFDFDMPITDDLPLYANWLINEYIVTFEDANGEPGQRVAHGNTATRPDDPKRDGFTFDGWYTDATYTTEFDFSQPITSNTTVYAKWEKDAPVTPDPKPEPEPEPKPEPDPEPEIYELNVSGAFVYVDGVDLTAVSGDTSLTPKTGASIRLVADPDRMPSGMVFDRWTVLSGKLLDADAEKLETSRTLTEFTFTMPAEPLSIEATPRMLEEESSDTASVILGVTLGTAATAVVAWQAYDIGMTLYQEHWLPADFVMPKTRAELALLLWNAAGRPATAAQPAFADITDPDTAQAAQWAVETGLLTAKSADTFQPEKSVPRWKAVRTWNRVTGKNN